MGRSQATIDAAPWSYYCFSDIHIYPESRKLGCTDPEEKFDSLCYKKCSLLTDGKMPLGRMLNAFCNVNRSGL